MAFALVGTIGAVSQGAVNSSVTPAWGAGESRTANNLLICWVGGTESNGTPPTPSGWSVGRVRSVDAFAGASAAIFYKIAAGGDAAPTINAVANIVWSVQLAEFSGNDVVPLDQSGSQRQAGGTSLTATSGGVDAGSGELICAAGAMNFAAATNTSSHTLNNGATSTETKNDGTSTADHYNFTYGVTTGNVGADSDTLTHLTNSDNALVIVSFKVSTITTTVRMRTMNRL